jgi:hypothetical protein
MSNWIDRVLTAYRPLYLRGLLMDGQYRMPQQPKKPPASGKRAIYLTPVFEPARRRVLVATATAAVVSLCASTTRTMASESNTEPLRGTGARLDKKQA